MVRPVGAEDEARNRWLRQGDTRPRQRQQPDGGQQAREPPSARGPVAEAAMVSSGRATRRACAHGPRTSRIHRQPESTVLCAGADGAEARSAIVSDVSIIVEALRSRPWTCPRTPARRAPRAPAGRWCSSLPGRAPQLRCRADVAGPSGRSARGRIRPAPGRPFHRRWRSPERFRGAIGRAQVATELRAPPASIIG